MTQGQEVPAEAPANKPTLEEVVNCWNLVTDNIKPMILYLAKVDLLTLEDVGGAAEALDVISNIMRANLKLHNDAVLAESNRRGVAEKGIREKLAEKQAAKDALEHGEVTDVVKTKSSDNDPAPEDEPDAPEDEEVAEEEKSETVVPVVVPKPDEQTET